MSYKEQSSEQVNPTVKFSRPRRRLLKMGLSALMMTTINCTPLTQEIKPLQKRVDINYLLEIGGKNWEIVPNHSKWRRTSILSPDPDEKLGLPWELLLLISPEDQITARSSFPYVTRQSLMKGETPLDAPNGAIVAARFRIYGDFATEKNPMTTDGGILTRNVSYPPHGQGIYLSSDYDQLKLHLLEDREGTGDLSQSSINYTISRLNIVKSSVLVTLGLKINSDGTSIQTIDPGGNLSERISLSKPFYPNDKLTKFELTAFTRRGFNIEIDALTVARPTTP